LANATGVPWTVEVVWQAIPESMNYFTLGESAMQAVDQKFLNQLNMLVPLEAQATWRNLVYVVASLDELVGKVNALLKAEVVPPTGTELVLAEVATIWRPRPPNGHDVEQAAMLRDASSSVPHQWTFTVSYDGESYTARAGLTYLCLIARMP